MIQFVVAEGGWLDAIGYEDLLTRGCSDGADGLRIAGDTDLLDRRGKNVAGRQDGVRVVDAGRAGGDGGRS